MAISLCVREKSAMVEMKDLRELKGKKWCFKRASE